MAKNKLNKSWLHDHINDPYVKLAQREGYRARAAYKLLEIDESEHLIKPGQIIVDLGCTLAVGRNMCAENWRVKRVAGLRALLSD
jgi:predicted rRNA methylase YqxC with S4 and FtsJ domains